VFFVVFSWPMPLFFDAARADPTTRRNRAAFVSALADLFRALRRWWLKRPWPNALSQRAEPCHARSSHAPGLRAAPPARPASSHIIRCPPPYTLSPARPWASAEANSRPEVHPPLQAPQSGPRPAHRRPSWREFIRQTMRTKRMFGFPIIICARPQRQFRHPSRPACNAPATLNRPDAEFCTKPSRNRKDRPAPPSKTQMRNDYPSDTVGPWGSFPIFSSVPSVELCGSSAVYCPANSPTSLILTPGRPLWHAHRTSGTRRQSRPPHLQSRRHQHSDGPHRRAGARPRTQTMAVVAL